MKKGLYITILLAGVALTTNVKAKYESPEEELQYMASHECQWTPESCTYENGHLIRYYDELDPYYARTFEYDSTTGNLIGMTVGVVGNDDYFDWAVVKWDATTGHKVEEISGGWDNDTYTKYDAVTGNKTGEYSGDSYTKYNESGYPTETNYVDFSFDTTTGTATITETGQKTVYAYETNDDGELVQIMSSGKDNVQSKFWEDNFFGGITIYNADGSIKSSNLLYGSMLCNDTCFELFLEDGNSIELEYSEDTNTYSGYDEDGNLLEYSSLTNIIKGITVADEEAANKPQSTRTQLADGSTRVVDPDGKVHYEGKRIYTNDEALEVSGPKNRFRIRYK